MNRVIACSSHNITSLHSLKVKSFGLSSDISDACFLYDPSYVVRVFDDLLFGAEIFGLAILVWLFIWFLFSIGVKDKYKKKKRDVKK